MSAPPAPATRTPADLALLAEALIVLTAASAAVRFLPFRATARLASLPTPKGRRRSPDEAARRIRWAVEAWVRRVPWRAVCFQIGLATHWMLRRRGLPSRLHYGVGQEGEVLKAHVWVTLEGAAVIGGAEAERYACVATFPPTAEGHSATSA